MSKKLIFIMSESEAYLRDEVLRISKSWEFEKSNVKTVDTWDPSLVRGSVSLFGDVSMVHLDLSDISKLRAFVKLLNDKKSKAMFEEDDWYGPGLIITSTHARGAKRIENVVNASGGTVQKKVDPEKMKKILLKRVSLNQDTINFLNAYAGKDYQILIGIVNQLEILPKEEQKSMTINELVVRLPSKPGSVPPWDFVNAMLDGKTNESIDLYERAMEGSHVLVTMSLARARLQLLYRLKLLLDSGVWRTEEQAEILGERKGPNIWIPANVAKKLDVRTAEYLAKLALKTEADLKGHSSSDPDIIFKNFIASACLAINYNRALPLNLR